MKKQTELAAGLSDAQRPPRAVADLRSVDRVPASALQLHGERNQLQPLTQHLGRLLDGIKIDRT